MKQVTAILIGAGLRGAEVYSEYAIKYPNEFRVVAVAEPDEKRRRIMAERHGIPTERQYESYEEILAAPRMADCAMVCTQDRLHYEPVKLALQKGYHVLCEKPMSPKKEEIIQMGMMAEKYHRVLSICHVLRYSPFFSKIKELLEQGRIGRLMSIQHMEQVGFWHHAHSFVRGNWRNSEETSPMILQKCCHDMDILLWLVGSPCRKVSSFGRLTYFKEENVPGREKKGEAAPEYCMDGCSYREECPFYAPRFYLEHPKAFGDGLVKAVTPSLEREDILKALEKGPYGRCVFRCDNNVVDHQIVNLEFENQVTASLTMSAFTNECRRSICLMGTEGEIRGDMEAGVIELFEFVSGNREKITLNTPTTGHSGSDEKIMKAFVELIASEKRQEATGAEKGARGESISSASVSVDSHLMALAAEEARVSGEVIDLKAYKEKLCGTVRGENEI